MHIDRVFSHLQAPDPGITFVSPILSAIFAALSIRDPNRCRLMRFNGSCESYASNNGLLDTLRGEYKFPERGGTQGLTYTKLTRLSNHSEVDGCNAVIIDLIHNQLVGYSPAIVSQLTKIVGELHDNVASHANGAGFSCAQVYNDGDVRRVEFAIADAGCGMLKNVSRQEPSIVDDKSAIAWCLEKGNTTARANDNWAQRLPDDCQVSPFPESVETFQSEDHHAGLGLWKLSEFVKVAGGSMAVLSGSGDCRCIQGQNTYTDSSVTWTGVAIEFEICIPKDAGAVGRQNEQLEQLAARLGI